MSVAKHTSRELITRWAVALTCYISQWFSNFLTTEPFFLRYSWRTPAIVTVKFTTSTNTQILVQTAYYKLINIINYIQITMDDKQC